MDDLPIQKIQISGPTLASLLHRFSSSPGDVHGLLYGNVKLSMVSSLSDDPTSASTSSAAPSASTSSDSTFTATITSFLSLPSNLPLPISPLPSYPSSTLLGWFSGRRKTPLRPSLNDSITAHSFSSSMAFTFSPENSPDRYNLSASLFLVLSTPFQDQLIHTHEYKAFQYRVSTDSFEPRSIDVINIGPSFRSHYESFAPNSAFPLMPCELRAPNAMAEDNRSDGTSDQKRSLKDQKELDLHAEGYEIGRLTRLMGSEAVNYTGELEDLYNKMLAKLDGLSRMVEKSSAQVLEQETHNMKMRLRVAGLE